MAQARLINENSMALFDFCKADILYVHVYIYSRHRYIILVVQILIWRFGEFFFNR